MRWSKTTQQLGLEQTHHCLQRLGTGVKAQKVLPNMGKIAPGQCFRRFQTSGGAAAIHLLNTIQDLRFRKAGFSSASIASGSAASVKTWG